PPLFFSLLLYPSLYFQPQHLISASIFFFFKQKTAYEITRRDWSSDVCSSDLALPALDWQPTEPDARLLEAVTRRVSSAGLANLRVPLRLDVLESDWSVEPAAAIVCINMIHIAPWAATEALIRGAARVLASGGPLCLYGPFRRGGRHTAPSNEAFDQSLRARNAEWGVRDLDEVERCARRCGFELAEVVSMPANNFTVVLTRVA